MTSPSGIDGGPFVRAYIGTLLWSSVDDNGEPLDSIDATPAPSLYVTALHECAQFVGAAGALLDDWDSAQAGHDFALTRNRHGAGFWDRGMDTGDALTKLAHTFGPADLYVGDDGLIYQAGAETADARTLESIGAAP